MSSPSPNRQTSSSLLFFSLLAFRLINALTLRTFFQPDEYFQSLEPAWKWAFGSGSGAWVTWEWREQLRSSLHPLLFSSTYALVNHLTSFLDAGPFVRAQLLLAAPKILQAHFAAITDFFTYRSALAISPHGDEFAKVALALTISNPWQWFCSTRTLSNSLETTLTVVALSFWPWPWFLSGTSMPSAERDREKKESSLFESTPGSLAASLCLAAVACILRPTNILIWAGIVVASMLRYHNWDKAIPLLRSCLIYGSAVLTATVAIDWSFYGEFAFPPLRFLYFNLVQSLAVFYGTNRPDYYFTEGLPLLLTTALPFAVVGIAQALFSKPQQATPSMRPTQQILFLFAVAVVVSTATLSLISHKEVRFIFPLLPLLHILAAKPLLKFCNPLRPPPSWWRRSTLLFLLVANIFIAYYVSYVHQRGVVDVMHYVRQEHEARLMEDSMTATNAVTTTVGFFMPCHSTPWRSHLVHPGIYAWALTCEPPLHLSMSERQHYLDEADVFYADPVAWIKANMNEQTSPQTSESDDDIGRRPWPQYLVFFEQLEPTVKSVLADSSYKECWRGFNTHWHDDWRRQGDVVVWCAAH